MDVLSTITRKKADRLAQVKSSVSLQDLKSAIRDSGFKARNFRDALIPEAGHISLIAELKKASPSRGVIRPDFDAAAIASIYESRSASALSVLTEEDFFKGSLQYLEIAREVTSKPILRKDFIFDEYQIYESKARGADALLLIAAILEKNQAAEYLLLSGELGLGVLFEVHDEKDLEKALEADADIIGINNRDLKTLRIDLSTTLRLIKDVPKGCIAVSESGIKNRDDVVKLMNAGVSAILVGTSLVASKDIGEKIDELTGTVNR